MRLVTLSSTATAGLLPIGLILLLTASAKKFHGVAHFKTVHVASVSIKTTHKATGVFALAENVDSHFTTTERAGAKFTTTYECEASL